MYIMIMYSIHVYSSVMLTAPWGIGITDLPTGIGVPMGYWDHLRPIWDWGIGITCPMGYWDHLPPNWDWGIGITYLPTGYRPMGRARPCAHPPKVADLGPCQRPGSRTQ